MSDHLRTISSATTEACLALSKRLSVAEVSGYPRQAGTFFDDLGEAAAAISRVADEIEAAAAGRPVAFYRLLVPKGIDACSVEFRGVMLRAVHAYDIATDKMRYRFDAGYIV